MSDDTHITDIFLLALHSLQLIHRELHHFAFSTANINSTNKSRLTGKSAPITNIIKF